MNLMNPYIKGSPTPSYYAKIYSWLDSTTGIATTGTNVNSWTDKINGRVWTMGGYGASTPQLVSGKYDTLNNNSNTNALTLTGSAANTVEVLFVIERYGNSFHNYLLGNTGSLNGFVADYNNGSSYGNYTFDQASGVFFKNSGVFGEKRFVHFTFTNVDPINFNGFVLGVRSNGSYSGGAYIYESIMFHTALTPTERTALYAEMLVKHPTITNP